jgi:hypothetical protein
VGGTKTGSAVESRLVGNTELCQVASDHLGTNLDGVENSSVIDTHDSANLRRTGKGGEEEYNTVSVDE